MAILIDTSVLGRLANRADSAHSLAQSALAELHRRGEVLHITAQNSIEFRNFATRPTGVNGLGLLLALRLYGSPRLKQHFRFWKKRLQSTRHGSPWWILSALSESRCMMRGCWQFATSTGSRTC